MIRLKNRNYFINEYITLRSNIVLKLSTVILDSLNGTILRDRKLLYIVRELFE